MDATISRQIPVNIQNNSSSIIGLKWNNAKEEIKVFFKEPQQLSSSTRGSNINDMCSQFT